MSNSNTGKESIIEIPFNDTDGIYPTDSYDQNEWHSIKIPGNPELFDISISKKAYACFIPRINSLIENSGHGEYRSWKIEVYALDNSLETQKQLYTCHVPKNDINLLKKTKYDRNFLSVSSGGKYVALSFYKLDKDGHAKINKEVYHYYIVFENNNNGEGKIIKKERYNGRAVFLSDDRLALINLARLEVLDNTFNLEYLLDLSTITEGINAAPWKYYSEYTQNKNDDWSDNDGDRLISISRYIQMGVLATIYNEDVTRIWLVSDGSLLTSFRKGGDEDIKAISKQYQYIATYSVGMSLIRIYDSMSGLIVNRLETGLRAKSLMFSDNRKNLLVIGSNKDDSEDYDLYYECWNIEKHKIIFSSKLSQFDRHMHGPMVMPFVMKHTSTQSEMYKIAYICQDDDKSIKMCINSFSISEIDEHHGWEVVADNYTYLTDSYKDINNTLDDYSNLICFKGDVSLIEKYDHSTNQSSGSNAASNNPTVNEQENSEDIGDVTCERGDLECSNDEASGSEAAIIRLLLGLPMTKQNKKVKEGPFVVLLIFNTCTVQLWKILDDTDSKSITAHELLFIKTHEPPFYNQNQKYNSTYKLKEGTKAKDIRFMKNCPGRIQYILQDTVSQKEYLEEIFLPLFLLHDGEYKAQVDCCYMESNLNALHYLYFRSKDMKVLYQTDDDYKHIVQRENSEILYVKVLKKVRDHLLVGNYIEFVPIYFSTGPGNKTMAMLASFEFGQDILQKLFSEVIKPINIISYRSKENSNSNISRNLLTALVDNRKYNLMQYIFNKLIRSSFELGPGVFIALVDTLIYLQYKGYIDLLLTLTKKLSFISISCDSYPILSREVDTIVECTVDGSLKDLKACSLLECIPKYRGVKHMRASKLRHRCFNQIGKSLKKFRNIFRVPYQFQISTELCVVPFPYFLTYHQPFSDISDSVVTSNQWVMSQEQGSEGQKSDINKIEYKKKSLFVEHASSQYRNQIFKQGDTIIEVMLNYKLSQFSFVTFFGLFISHFSFYTAYLISVSFPQSVFSYELGLPITHVGHISLVTTMFLALFILIIQEARQCTSVGVKEYINSPYNWIDIATYMLTVITFLQMRLNLDARLGLGSITILLLWVHAMLRLRIIRIFGGTLQIIIHLFKGIFPTLIVMVLCVFAFTNSFMFLHNDKSDDYFQDNFEGQSDNSINISLTAVSSSNPFVNIPKALSVLWLCLYGVWDPLTSGDAGDHGMTVFLSVLFGFVVAVIFLNIVIAIMSNTVAEMTKKGNSIWLSHYAAMISEIETIWCTNSHRRNRQNNPNFVYYYAHDAMVTKYSKTVEKELDDLMKELKPHKELLHVKYQEDLLKSLTR